MMLICPHCSTQYQINSDAFQSAGEKKERVVRCAKCNHKWTYRIKEHDDTKGQPTKNTPYEDAIEAPLDSSSPISKSKKQLKKRRFFRLIILWVFFFSALFAVWYKKPWNHPKIKESPWLASAVKITEDKMAASYIFLSNFIQEQLKPKGLGLSLILAEHDFESTPNGRSLIIYGRIANNDTIEQESPLVQITLKDDQGRNLLTWRVKAEDSNIKAGETTRFWAKTLSPPDETERVFIEIIANEKK